MHKHTSSITQTRPPSHKHVLHHTNTSYITQTRPPSHKHGLHHTHSSSITRPRPASHKHVFHHTRQTSFSHVLYYSHKFAPLNAHINASSITHTHTHVHKLHTHTHTHTYTHPFFPHHITTLPHRAPPQLIIADAMRLIPNLSKCPSNWSERKAGAVTHARCMSWWAIHGYFIWPNVSFKREGI